MTTSLMPLLRQAAACLDRALGASAMRFAVVVAIVTAIASSAHAATPFEVRVTGSGLGCPNWPQWRVWPWYPCWALPTRAKPRST